MPGAADYTLYYTTNKILPEVMTGLINGPKLEKITSPCILSGLSNGYLHTFLLKANPQSGWPESLSHYVKTIPLAEQTLAPTVKGEFRQIRIKWNSIPGTDEYEVWKALAHEGPYKNISGTVKENPYIDTNTENDTWYYYKIKPTLKGTESSTFRSSTFNGAQTDPFFIDTPAFTGSYDTIGLARGVYKSGSYAYVAGGISGLQIINIANPETPTLTGLYNTSGSADGVSISGSYAYVADGPSGLQILDLLP